MLQTTIIISLAYHTIMMMQPVSAAAPLPFSSNLRGYDNPPIGSRRLIYDSKETFEEPLLKGLPEIEAPSANTVKSYVIINLVIAIVSCAITCTCWWQNTCCACKVCIACCCRPYRKKWVAKNLQVILPPPTPKHNRSITEASTVAEDVVIEMEEGGKNEKDREVGDDQTRI